MASRYPVPAQNASDPAWADPSVPLTSLVTGGLMPDQAAAAAATGYGAGTAPLASPTAAGTMLQATGAAPPAGTPAGATSPTAVQRTPGGYVPHMIGQGESVAQWLSTEYERNPEFVASYLEQHGLDRRYLQDENGNFTYKPIGFWEEYGPAIMGIAAVGGGALAAGALLGGGGAAGAAGAAGAPAAGGAATGAATAVPTIGAAGAVPGAVTSAMAPVAAAGAGAAGVGGGSSLLGSLAGPLGQTAIGAGTSLLGAYLQSRANNKATDANAKALENALNFEKDVYGFQKETAQPYLNTGNQANSNLSQYLANPFTLPTGDEVRATPGYQFRFNEGERALEQSAFTRGVGLTGGAGKALAQYGQNVADTGYGDYVSRALAARQQNVGENQSAVDAALRAAGNARPS